MKVDARPQRRLLEQQRDVPAVERSLVRRAGRARAAFIRAPPDRAGLEVSDAEIADRQKLAQSRAECVI
jgi:hypothetical protein